METYEDSLKLWENYVISEADRWIVLMKFYKDSYLKNNYDFILKKEAQLIEKICEGKMTFLRVFTVYYFLLWNGYFSNNNFFEFNKPGDNYIEKMPGLSVICGEGVCFNISSHFCDILKYLTKDYRCYTVGMHLEKNDKWNSEHPKIKKYVHCFLNLLSSDSDLLNHANVLIVDKGNFYILDPTNFLVYEVVEHKKNNQLPTRIELRAHINLDSSYAGINELRNAAEGLKNLNNVLSNRKYIRCSEAGLSKIMNTGINLCEKHMNDILAFREETDYVYKHIALNMSDFSKQIKNKVRRLENK